MMDLKRGGVSAAALLLAVMLSGCSTMGDDSGGIAANAQPDQLTPVQDSSVASTSLPPIGGADGQVQVASATPDPLAPDEIGLFCIGAHMSGLPLCPQLEALGGRFLREDRTTAEYRLFSLGNRPGLLHAPNGAAIAGEVWALPTATIGALLAQVPPPLGFGSVRLENGPCLGFLAEAAGVASATDITSHGGWRAYLAA